MKEAVFFFFLKGTDSSKIQQALLLYMDRSYLARTFIDT